MNKIVIRRPGGFDSLRLELQPDPEPQAGEVVVATRAIGVNYADCIARMGLYKSANEFAGWPLTPGFEFAGEVAALGEGVSEFSVGDRVLGVTRFGAYSERVVVDRAQLLPLPASIGFEQAGAFQVAYLTAWYGLFVLGAAKAGSTVLVYSAAGGVGSAVCQLAKSEGARVLGVVGSAHKLEHALAQGAERVLVQEPKKLAAQAREFSPRGFDVVLDANGATTLRTSFGLLAPMGRLIVYGFSSMISHGGKPNFLQLLWRYLRTPRFDPLEMVDRNVAVFAFNLSYLFDELTLYRETMSELLRRVESGAIRPLDVAAYPLAEAGRAHQALQSGQTRGKLVLVNER
ncbi:MAG: medium chain dehydrogenase/reductase family protein [Myxococcota bacterium]|nr:medium chain dehydrogenase/reductase family protein [Myxococcota bacterium]